MRRVIGEVTNTMQREVFTNGTDKAEFRRHLKRETTTLVGSRTPVAV